MITTVAPPNCRYVFARLDINDPTGKTPSIDFTRLRGANQDYPDNAAVAVVRPGFGTQENRFNSAFPRFTLLPAEISPCNRTAAIASTSPWRESPCPARPRG